MFQQCNASYPIIRLPFKSMVKYYELIDVYKKKELKYSSELVQRGLVQLFLAYIYEDARPYIEVDTKNSESVQTVTVIIEYIQKHLANYSISYICSAFRSVMNKTINNYIKEKRLDLAVQYLKADIPITEAAEQAGFNNYSYFYKTFKSVYGISPVEYRNRTLQENDER